jgi:hypothetical protein
MASKVVDHLKKLIVALSPSKKNEAVHKDAPVSTTNVVDAPVTTTTVAVHEMLFGAPMPMEFTNLQNQVTTSSVGVATQRHYSSHDDANEDAISGVLAVAQTESHAWSSYVAVKEEPVEKNGLATGVAMAIVTGDALDTIDADDMSSVAQDVLLVYPFLGADNVEKASWELPLCDTGDDFTTSQLITNQLEKSVGRNHIQTITQFDRYSLYDNQFVNNIDFWML